MRAFSLYIHIPFCSHKCPYCDFNTYAVSQVPEAAYVAALCAELAHYRDSVGFSGRRVQTVFFGGGTPSLLSAAAIERVMIFSRECFEFTHDAEVTLEANPYLVTTDLLVGYRQAGVNRLSYGAQSFNSTHLRTLGREHSSDDIERSIADSRRAGISNISLDILFGVPGQTLLDFTTDIERAVELAPHHISTYSLTIEPGTPFFQRQARKLFSLPPDDVVREMLDYAPELLGAHGFERYEISNYARPGAESRHNSAYWIGDDYLGVGAGAHSLLVGYEGQLRKTAVRWSNTAHYNDYIPKVVKGSAVSWREHLTAKDLEFEFFYLGLRRSAGVNLQDFLQTFCAESFNRYGEIISDLEAEELVCRSDDWIRLTKSGIALADSVFERFVD